MRKAGCVVLLAIAPLSISAGQDTTRFTHADTLRGANSPARAWWDVAFYDLHVRVEPRDSSISGWNGIVYRVLRPARELQVDLQVPLEVDSMVQSGAHLAYRRDGNAFFVTLRRLPRAGVLDTLTVYYHGKPRVARRPPWDGGFIWAQDSLGHAWVATANEGLGASVWWPNKDYLADEPDSQRIAITVPDSLVDVSNGRLRGATHHPDGTTTYEWFVADPINNYDVAVDAARFAHFGDVYDGEWGALTLDFWPLAYHADTARVQFQQARSMLKCFESWFGPYPWYQDGYKLVESPRRGIRNDRPIIARYGVNAQGSGDMYPKSGNMLHTIRQLVADDAKWRGVLRGLSRSFWHRTVTSQEIEDYLIRETGLDLAAVFRQYLTTTQIPVLEYRLAGDTLGFHWTNVVPGFAMPVRVTVADSSFALLHPTEAWQTTVVQLSRPEAFHVDENFYVETKAIAPAPSPTRTPAP